MLTVDPTVTRGANSQIQDGWVAVRSCGSSATRWRAGQLRVLGILAKLMNRRSTRWLAGRIVGGQKDDSGPFARDGFIDRYRFMRGV